MSRNIALTPEAQLRMPGMPVIRRSAKVLSCCSVEAGQEVTYFGKIIGGPKFGARGTILKALQQRAVVDMGNSGTWNIPYYFLSDKAA